MASPGVWKQDPKTGQWGWATGTDPNLPVDTTSDFHDDLANPQQQQAENAGLTQWPDQPVAAPTQAATPAASTTPWGSGTPNVGSYGIPGYTASNYGAAPGGWDATKWNDPLHQTPKYVWGRIVQAGKMAGETTDQMVAHLVQAYPGTIVHGDNAIMPWGETVDIFTDYGTSPLSTNGVSWNVLSGPGGAAAGGSGGQMQLAAAPNVNMGAAPVSIPDVPAPSSSAYDDEIHQFLLGLMNTPQTVDENALMSSPENRAFRLSQQRSEERQRGQLAEDAAAGGYPGGAGAYSNSGGFDTALQGIRSKRGEDESQFLGQLAITRMQDQKQKMLTGIQLATQQGQFDQAQKLQVQLANLNKQLAEAQLAENRRQYDLGLGFNYTSLQSSMDRDATLALMDGL